MILNRKAGNKGVSGEVCFFYQALHLTTQFLAVKTKKSASASASRSSLFGPYPSSKSSRASIMTGISSLFGSKGGKLALVSLHASVPSLISNLYCAEGPTSSDSFKQFPLYRRGYQNKS